MLILTDEEVEMLAKRIKWELDNQWEEGCKYVRALEDGVDEAQLKEIADTSEFIIATGILPMLRASGKYTPDIEIQEDKTK